MAYALVRAGAVVDTVAAIPSDSVQAPRPGKGYWLPLVDVVPQYDADTETLDGPAVDVGAGQVTRTWTARARTADEWESLRAAPLARIEREYAARWQAPIDYAGHTWHADQEAVGNISGVVLMIAAGVPVPNPRPWTPLGSLTPVSLTHAELVGLGAAIAARKDALFVVKKAKQAEVAALSSVSALLSYNATAGWE
jgi:hypothetical protein